MNVNLASMSTEALMTVYTFYKLLLQWTFTILRLYQARLIRSHTSVAHMYAYI